ncbi:hypothetical protein BGZ99_008515 [Dissophora globulifera]|uniref:Uncharacterized protein n=1 Tax=Dissophora globulifera TaxID=979702 RepID=A0A9P6RB49_9FUNG|nr:hypothetical protein BGZ99_008515 [Dissophora globulifera]
MSSSKTNKRIGLQEFKLASPDDLSLLAFVRWRAGTPKDKEKLNSAYVSLFTEAKKSPLPEIRADGEKMEQLWKDRSASMQDYWETKTLTKLRSKNLVAAAKNSSALQIAVGDQQLKDGLLELQGLHGQHSQERLPAMEHEQEQEQADGNPEKFDGSILSDDESSGQASDDGPVWMGRLFQTLEGRSLPPYSAARTPPIDRGSGSSTPTHSPLHCPQFDVDIDDDEQDQDMMIGKSTTVRTSIESRKTSDNRRPSASTITESLSVAPSPFNNQSIADTPVNMNTASRPMSADDCLTSNNHPGHSNSQHKRKASVYHLDLKPASFPPPNSPSESGIHAAFDKFRERCRAIAEAGSLDFARHKAEALALNGIWLVGKAALDCSHAKEIQQKMSREYRVPEYPDITTLTPELEEILQFGNEQEISEAVDKISSADIPWTARRALKIWRQLLDTLPSEPRREQDGEQTFVHQVLRPFVSVTFSARGTKMLKGDIEHASANEDKIDHKSGVRSDFFVILPISSLDSSLVGLVGEVKPPAKSLLWELKDQWKLFRMMKSEMDSQIKKGIQDPVVWGCQVFGYDVVFYVMDQRIPLINCLLKVFSGTLPKSIEDVSAVGRIISAFFFVEGRISKQGEELERSILTPPLDPELHTQPNQITPKKPRKS